MNTINPNSTRVESEKPRDVDASWKVSDNPPPIILGLQSQFAHLQLIQSKVCKEKAEDSIRQVQDSQKKQHDSRIFASEAQRLLEKAKRDGKTDVNKELEAFCKQHGIEFKKLDIQKGEANWGGIFASLALTIGGAWAVSFAAIVVCALVELIFNIKIPDISLKELGKLIGTLVDLGLKLASVVRAWLPKELQFTLDAVITILRIIKQIVDPEQARTPAQRKEDVAALRKYIDENPINMDHLNAIMEIGRREGIFTLENARRVADDMGIDLNDTMDKLQTAGNAMAANTDASTPWYYGEMDEVLAKILLYPLALVLMWGNNESYEDAMKKLYVRTKIGEVCDADGLRSVQAALEAMNAQEAGRSQMLMVAINNHIGQYNSYLQGAMTAIANANQVNTALAKGTG